jgi:hypothetical protein
MTETTRHDTPLRKTHPLVVSLMVTARARPLMPVLFPRHDDHGRMPPQRAGTADIRPVGVSRTGPDAAASAARRTLQDMPVPSKRLKDLIEGTSRWSGLPLVLWRHRL